MLRGLSIIVGLCVVADGRAADPKVFPITFRDVTRDAGLLEPLAGIMGHGGAWGDIDGDGKPDLFVGGFCDRPNAEYKPAEGPVSSRLFRNLGNGKFERIRETPTTFFGRTSGAVFADLDNDGLNELYAANNARAKGKQGLEPQGGATMLRSKLFHNVKGKFVDIAKESGACPDSLLSARNIGVFDYNADGLLDLLVVEDRFTPKPRTTLFRNEGKMRFVDVTKEVGLPEDVFGLGLAVADLNEDGRPDFFVPHSNRLFLSTPEGKYREAVELKEVFAWKSADKEDWPCGACFADLNQDGKLDLVLSIHHVKARNKVFINLGLKDGIPQFKDVTKEVGLDEMIPARCPHVEVQDFDNDGLPDIFLSAGQLKDDQFHPLIYRNAGIKDGLPKFAPSIAVQGPLVYYPAGPSTDYDGDGRIDLFLINWFQGNHSRLLRNVSAERGYLNVKVVGKKMNRMGIGAKVAVYRAGQLGKAEALLGYQEITIGYGYASGQLPIAHFGLSDMKEVDVLVTLPHGKKIERTKIGIGNLSVEE